MASSFDFKIFVTRLKALNIDKTGWDALLVNLTSAWNENNQYSLKATAVKVKRVINSKFGSGSTPVREDVLAIINGKLKPQPGKRGLSSNDLSSKGSPVPSRVVSAKPDTVKSKRSTSKYKERTPDQTRPTDQANSDVREQMKQYNEDMKKLWNALQKPSPTKPTCKPPDDMVKLSKEIFRQVEILQKETAELQHNIKDLQDKLEQANLERQAQEQSTRLSKIQTARMTGTFPVVNELSDASRPTKLRERFSELYDFQWTYALQQLTSSGKNEKDAIQHLYKLLEKCHTFCVETDKYQTSVIQSTSTCSFHDFLQLSHVFTDIKLANVDSQMVLDLRKRNLEETTRNLQNQFVMANGQQGNVFNGSVKVFADLCVEICWLMRLHFPPLFLDTNADKKKEGQFNTDIFKPYTSSGKKIKFVVWPPLFLHEGGPMLSKGIAEG